MLRDFDEIEDMMCSICMDQMSVGETIVKTKCGIENVFPSSEDEALLKGHKFHHDCFKSWLSRGIQNISDML